MYVITGKGSNISTFVHCQIAQARNAGGSITATTKLRISMANCSKSMPGLREIWQNFQKIKDMAINMQLTAEGSADWLASLQGIRHLLWSRLLKKKKIGSVHKIMFKGYSLYHDKNTISLLHAVLCILLSFLLKGIT